MKSGILILSFLVAAPVFSSAKSFPRPKTWGPLRAKVLFVSPKLRAAGQNSNLKYFKTKAVLEWGVNTYQVGDFYYECQASKNICPVVDFKVRATYQKCIIQSAEVRCSRKVQTSTDSQGDSHRDSYGDLHRDDPENDFSRDTWYDGQRRGGGLGDRDFDPHF